MLHERTFFLPESKARVTRTIKEIEGQTSAEIVVAARRSSGAYRDVGYLVGFAIALATLSFSLFHPASFSLVSMPIDVVVAFVVGAVAAGTSNTLRRVLVPSKTLALRCREAARSRFFDLGVGKTSGRNGILVYASVLERRVEIVADLGVDVASEAWKGVASTLESSLAGGADIESFVSALAALGPVLGSVMPRQADDVNELPDEVDG
jgi:putative membrane protein